MKMKIPIHQLDAFAEQPFSGNPAAVCPLAGWLDDSLMQQIAMENNLSETAFIVEEANGPRIRWFTPAREVSLCGHATLAAAHVWFDEKASTSVTFHSLSGPLTVSKLPDGALQLDFPSRAGTSTPVPKDAKEVFGAQPRECLRSVDDLMLVFESEQAICALTPDFGRLAQWDARGVITTAQGDACDFVSRFFAPRFGINEDPVTGSAHCVLAPYWAERLGKLHMIACQRSPRRGTLSCEMRDSRVLISGRVIPYMKGQIEI